VLQHVEEIYGPTPAWPRRPLFYASVTSLSDESMAPAGCENLFILVPLAPGLEDTEEARAACFEMVRAHLEDNTKPSQHACLNRFSPLRT
jgi:phytoene desaturase